MVPLSLVLASSSPRRRELLAILGIPFEICAEKVDETRRDMESPSDLVKRLALTKAGAVANSRPDALVIGADTLVEVDGEVLGKPKDKLEAVEFLRRLQGRGHRVHTGVALVQVCNGIKDVRVSSTEVFFRPLSEDEMQSYVATGEPMDKAGAYAIQGIGAILVERIAGDYFTVVGLPLNLLADMLQQAGKPILKEVSI